MEKLRPLISSKEGPDSHGSILCVLPLQLTAVFLAAQNFCLWAILACESQVLVFNIFSGVSSVLASGFPKFLICVCLCPFSIDIAKNLDWVNGSEDSQHGASVSGL